MLLGLLSPRTRRSSLEVTWAGLAMARTSRGYLVEELKEKAEVALGGPHWVKAEGSDVKTAGAGLSPRALAVLVSPGQNMGPWHTPSVSDTQDPSVKARYILMAPEEQALGEPSSRKPTLTTSSLGQEPIRHRPTSIPDQALRVQTEQVRPQEEQVPAQGSLHGSPSLCAAQPGALGWSLGKQDWGEEHLGEPHSAQGSDHLVFAQAGPPIQTRVCPLSPKHLPTSSTQSVGPAGHLSLCPAGLRCNNCLQSCLLTGLGAP